jgi:hypothetical protein
MIPGGQAFINKFVEDACRWTQFTSEPIFIIQTEWYTESVGDIYRSMGIQWNWQLSRWSLISAPIKVVPLSEILNGPKADPTDNDASMENNNLQKRVVCFNKDDPKRLVYYVKSDEEVLEFLRSTFELELWTSGQEIGDNITFECEPKLFTVHHTGQLKRVFCNTYTFADSVDNWENMCKCYLKIVKILTSKPRPLLQSPMEREPSAKRQKIEK